MMEFTYAINSEPVERVLAGFEEVIQDASPALARIADDFREMIAEQFATEGRAGGTPWAELAPSTLRRKRSARAGILYSTGALLRSLTDPGAFGQVEEMKGQSLTLGSRLAYALYHQTGTGRGFGQTQLAGVPRRGMPMRPIIVLSGDRSQRWVAMVRRHMEEKALVLGAKEMG